MKLFLLDLWVIGSDYWNSWNVPSWTISGELFAYLTFPLLAALVHFHPKFKYLILLLSTIVIAVLYESFDSRSLGDNISSLGLFRCLMEFLCGICVYNISLDIRDRVSQTTCHIAFWITVVFLGYLMIFFVENHLFVPLFFSALLLTLINFKSWVHQLLENKYLVTLGDISYSVYLTHTFILSLYTMILLENGESAGLIDVLCYLGITLVFSLLTYKYVEVPLRKLICNKALR